jgi:hypothetical protein
MTATTGEQYDERELVQEEQSDIPADTFALRLVMSRHHAGRLSIEQAAARCGLNAGNWAHWEDGRQPRDRPEVCFAIHRGLGMNLQWLLFGGALLGARGKEVKPRVRKGRPVNTTWYAGQTAGLSGGDGRVTGGRPKGRSDVTRPPISSASSAVQDGRSRRPVRINPVLPVDQVDVLINRA